MMKKILPITLSAIFLFMVTCGLAQDYDLIVRTKGDSIACRIDSITESYIYFEMKRLNIWAHTHIEKTEVSQYKRNAINKKQFIFEPGSSIIKSPKPVPAASMRDIQKNSVYVGILSINYSRMIPGDQVMFTVGGGLSFAPAAFDAGSVALMAETTLLKGGIKHFFEPGLLVFIDSHIFAPMVRLGYRFQDPGGFLLRAGLLFTYMDGFTLLPALSIGYSF